MRSWVGDHETGPIPGQSPEEDVRANIDLRAAHLPAEARANLSQPSVSPEVVHFTPPDHAPRPAGDLPQALPTLRRRDDHRWAIPDLTLQKPTQKEAASGNF